MKRSEVAKDIIRDFLVIFASIIIIITVLRQIFIPELAFDLISIYTIMGFSLLGALTGLMLYAPEEVSERAMRVRIVIHFLLLELLLITLASLIGAVASVSAALLFALQIAVVYAIVRLLSYEKDKKEAGQINERLKAVKQEVRE
ncbi:hypothetical protein C162_04804 [Paenibacillus sp. FSL R7-269]|uniref:DUF3021 family protein n=1 Tax=Paenibacillus sp. FSL R7-269 TaxID=1226755 RepID=UPI0003E25FB3|nr:DUF3021 family protein [Paenibacillus sp. FSL R7-269]ETT54139.1 hypothetical protein C162_04804 [Paenibacillus sp. FSL R7-269]